MHRIVLSLLLTLLLLGGNVAPASAAPPTKGFTVTMFHNGALGPYIRIEAASAKYTKLFLVIRHGTGSTIEQSRPLPYTFEMAAGGTVATAFGLAWNSQTGKSQYVTFKIVDNR